MIRLNSMVREPNTIYVASISYGKDSLAMLEAIKRLGYPLDRIISIQVWATDTIPADLPEMYEWKAQADEIIYQKYGIRVERISAKVGGGVLSYSELFYRELQDGKFKGAIKGFPQTIGSWCKKLKYEYINLRKIILHGHTKRVAKSRQQGKPLFEYAQKQPFSKLPDCTTGDNINIVQYLGIASDEPIRIERHINRKGIVLPLVDINWQEDYCGLWCKYSGLLSPVYTNGTRDGCWFCHNQGVEQLRLLRKRHPNLWKILLKWDLDSPVPFKSDGHTVHDYDKRFEMEDKGIISPNEPFFWKYLEKPPQRQLSMFDLIGEEK